MSRVPLPSSTQQPRESGFMVAFCKSMLLPVCLWALGLDTASPSPAEADISVEKNV